MGSIAGPSPTQPPLSPSSLARIPLSPSSSTASLDADDQENVTITSTRLMGKKSVRTKSQDDIRLLAVSTHMTELSYAISDIQTRIFEIQELRHKSQSCGDNTDASTNTVIDQQLMTLDERLEAVERGMKTISETLEPILQTSATPTVAVGTGGSENAALLRKHATLISEWETVQDESDVLREELKEDKWLTVFRTVTDQADGMMSSLEKAVNRCQEFIWQVHKRGMDDFQSNSPSNGRADKIPITMDVFTSLLESYEAKKKHYMPATSKVLSIIDKGVRDRVTKNGETLRRHAESAQRWKNLRDRILRTDGEMEGLRKAFLHSDSDHESTASGTTSTKNGYLATPPSGSRVSRISSSGSLSGSISPLRKLANKITGSGKKQPASLPTSPLSVPKKGLPAVEPSPSSASVTGTHRQQRASVFHVLQQATPSTPDRDRLGHKHSQSYTPDSSPRGRKVDKVDINATISARSNAAPRPTWNSSTRVENDERSRSLVRRPPSSIGHYTSYGDIPPMPSVGKRSASRTSMASSRPWSPISSSVSTTYSSSQFHHPPVSLTVFRAPSRAQTPSRAITPSLVNTPRHRPKTPSYGPSKPLRSISGNTPFGGWDDDDGASSSYFSRAQSPTFSAYSNANSPPSVHPPRPPSRSMIPVPAVHLHTPSRPGSTMSNYTRSESPSARGFRNAALRAQTPEYTLRARAQQVPVFQGSTRSRPSGGKLPPSSFKDRDASVARSTSGNGSVPSSASRPSSRAGAYTPSFDKDSSFPLHEYMPSNNFDPLDVEVATISNAIPHGLLIERVDPPLKKNQIPKEGEEIKAQYAFSNALSRKVVTLRLTTLMRSGKSGSDATKKVMCRVGGGWQDLSLYILNRQAGM